MSDFRLLSIGASTATLLVGFGFMPDFTYAQSTAPQPESDLGKLLSPAANAQLCYSAAPNQKANGGKAISKLLFQLGYGNHPAGTGDTPRGYYFDIAVTLDGQSETLRASGECRDRDSRAWCGVECDGGAFYIDLTPDINSPVLAFNPNDPRLRMAKCGSEDARELEFGVAGGGIKLEKAEPSVCEAMQ